MQEMGWKSYRTFGKHIAKYRNKSLLISNYFKCQWMKLSNQIKRWQNVFKKCNPGKPGSLASSYDLALSLLWLRFEHLVGNLHMPQASPLQIKIFMKNMVILIKNSKFIFVPIPNFSFFIIYIYIHIFFLLCIYIYIFFSYCTAWWPSYTYMYTFFFLTLHVPS